MNDRVTPTFFFWVLKYHHGFVYINDIYEGFDDTYASGGDYPTLYWDDAARLTRACYVAEVCHLKFTNRAGELLPGWGQVILDEGCARMSDYSTSVGQLLNDALTVSEAVDSGKISLSHVMNGVLTPDHLKESTNG
jgi:hypothetical protein